MTRQNLFQGGANKPSAHLYSRVRTGLVDSRASAPLCTATQTGLAPPAAWREIHSRSQSHMIFCSFRFPVKLLINSLCTCGTTMSPPGPQSAPAACYIQSPFSHTPLPQSPGVAFRWIKRRRWGRVVRALQTQHILPPTSQLSNREEKTCSPGNTDWTRSCLNLSDTFCLILSTDVMCC